MIIKLRKKKKLQQRNNKIKSKGYKILYVTNIFYCYVTVIFSFFLILLSFLKCRYSVKM